MQQSASAAMNVPCPAVALEDGVAHVEDAQGESVVHGASRVLRRLLLSDADGSVVSRSVETIEEV